LITIRSGAISDTIGRLPEMKITEPYSPRPRAKANAVPVRSAGRIAGPITRRKICNRLAPRLKAASSTSGSRSWSTGSIVRTTKGRPTKIRATKTPPWVKAILMPRWARPEPSQPLGE
jgi:hypothetical protein